MKKQLIVVLLLILGGIYAHATNLPRAEYPRPQFERSEWINLNGSWTYDFDFGESGKDKQFQKSENLGKQIIVLFCPESRLSGIQYTDFIKCMWYQCKINIPANWNNKKVYQILRRSTVRSLLL